MIRVLPLLIPLVTLAAWTIVFIRLSCEGAGCMSAADYLNSTQVHQSQFQQFLSNWEWG